MASFSPRLKLVGCIIGISILFSMIAVCGLAVWLGMNISSQETAIKTTLVELRSLQKSDDKERMLNEGPAMIQRLDIEVQTIRGYISPFYPILRLAEYLPDQGETLAQIEPVLEYAAHSVSAARKLADPIGEALAEVNSTNTETSADLNNRLFDLLVQTQKPVVEAQAELEQAVQWRKQVNTNVLPGWVQENIYEADASVGLIQMSLPIFQIAPVLLGSERPQTYLLALQNRDELRPTGGFITDFGLLRMDSGAISMLEFQDSTQVTDWTARVVDSPKPIREIMNAPYLVARDANWSPDFPTSARQIQELYSLSTDIQSDGVVAFDQSAVAELLRLIGPVTVDGETVDAGNVVTYMIEQKTTALASGQGLTRKQFIVDLGSVLVDHLLSTHDPVQLIKLAKLVQVLIETGRLNFYFDDPSAQAILSTYGWGGEIQPGSGDYLFTVDANIGFNKLSSLIQKNETYTVDLSDPADPKAHVQLTYKNPTTGLANCRIDQAFQNSNHAYIFPACYWTYWRVYTRGDTQVRSTNVIPVRAEDLMEAQSWNGEIDFGSAENGSAFVGGLAIIRTDETQSIQMDLALSPSVVQAAGEKRLYRLRVQKQAGVDAVNLIIGIRPPAGMQLEKPRESWLYDGDSGLWLWKGSVTKTLDLVVLFAPEP
jgi:hypothetical protein